MPIVLIIQNQHRPLYVNDLLDEYSTVGGGWFSNKRVELFSNQNLRPSVDSRSPTFSTTSRPKGPPFANVSGGSLPADPRRLNSLPGQEVRATHFSSPSDLRLSSLPQRIEDHAAAADVTAAQRAEVVLSDPDGFNTRSTAQDTQQQISTP